MLIMICIKKYNKYALILYLLNTLFILIVASNCPCDTDEYKVQFNQLGIFSYMQGCGTADSSSQTALKSKSKTYSFVAGTDDLF